MQVQTSGRRHTPVEPQPRTVVESLGTPEAYEHRAGTGSGISDQYLGPTPINSSISYRSLLSTMASGASGATEGKAKDRKCEVKSMAEFSEGLQSRLTSLGVKGAEFDKMTNDQKLSLLNMMGAMEEANLSLDGLTVDRKDGKLNVDQERVYFKADRAETFGDLESKVKDSGFKKNKFKEHSGMRESYRQPRKKDSLQIGFGKDGKTVEIDIDPNNPQKGKMAFLKHTSNVLVDGKTDPYDVQNRRFWECDCMPTPH